MSKWQCLGCCRFLRDEEYAVTVGGRLCNDCDSYMKTMREEPPYEPSPTGDEQP